MSDYKTYEVRVYADGYKEWFLNGYRHREDGPALENSAGKFWYIDGKHHRVDGPAIEYIDGSKEWWLNGYLHREDGPAVKCRNGIKYWYLNGKELSEQEFLARTKPATCEDKIVEIDGKKYKLVGI